MDDAYWSPNSVVALAEKVGHMLEQQQWVLTTAESCTGGGIAAAITEIAGSSAWFHQGFVTYSNEAKSDMLGVLASDLAAYGAVSYPVVAQMAQGALDLSDAQVAIAVSGVAGPGGGSVEKPVGTVFIAWCWRAAQASAHSNAVESSLRLCRHVFSGGRQTVRLKTQYHALQGVLRILNA